MAYTTIKKPSDYFNTVLYTGNGSTQSITGVGFQPDWLWIKSRSSAYNHSVWDAVRGASERLLTNSTDAEETQVGDHISFDSDGFTVGGGNIVNQSSQTYASWNWLASNTTASNTDGSITSTVSANNTSGFSVITWTGDGVGSTVGTGLSGSETIGFAIVKKRSTTSEWQTGVYGAYSANPRNFAYHLELNSTAALSGSSPYMMATQNSGDPSLLNLSTEGYVSGVDYVAYVFKPVKGFSKFGTYTGNGSTDGTFVYTGFKSAFVIIKQTNAAGENWFICDNKRAGYNAENNRLIPNLSTAEQSDSPIDILSNGFKARETGAKVNASGGTYIYMAFAEEPLVGDNPATAR